MNAQEILIFSIFATYVIRQFQSVFLSLSEYSDPQKLCSNFENLKKGTKESLYGFKFIELKTFKNKFFLLKK